MAENSPMPAQTSVQKRRDGQREALVAAAERTIAATGLSSLKARDLAADAGIALGAIYNLVRDMDELILRAGSRTAARLDEALLQAGGTTKISNPRQAQERLVALAIGYCRFAIANRNAWHALLTHEMRQSAELPDWAEQDRLRLIRHIAEPLHFLAPELPEQERNLRARTLFAATHGVVMLGLEDRLISVPQQELEAQLTFLVESICAGVATQDAVSAG